MFNRMNQPHLAQCYSRRIALMLYGEHESKIYFEVQLGVKKAGLWRVKTLFIRRDVERNNRFSIRDRE